MVEIDKDEKALRTNHLLVELYKSGLRGFAFDVWVDRGYFVFHVCVFRHDFKIQWWQKRSK